MAIREHPAHREITWGSIFEVIHEMNREMVYNTE